jgi:hypothetical protein
MSKSNDLQQHNLREWSKEVEELLQNLSEKANVWRLLHVKNHEIFKRRYYWFMIPIIILSSFTGSANLALGSISTEGSHVSTNINLAIGSLGIIITLISTLNNVFSYQRRKDDHSRSAKDWYRIHRMIDIELSLHRSRRINVDTFFQLILQDIERVHDSQPNIREDVIKDFMRTYKNKKLTIDIPEILALRKTFVYVEEKDNNVILDRKIQIVIDEKSSSRDSPERKIDSMSSTI